jgi:hypothetical protein
MTVFGNYAHYYDLLYQDKDYVGETQLIYSLIQAHNYSSLISFVRKSWAEVSVLLDNCSHNSRRIVISCSD